MEHQTYTIEVQGDHLERISQTSNPLLVIRELVWNALDAEATKVEIKLEKTELGLDNIVIKDNGHGIPHDEAPKLFKNSGGSWKKQSNRSKSGARILHGKEGKGRFKALSLGRTVDWKVNYSDDGDQYQYSITIQGDNLTVVKISNPEKVKRTSSGVEAKISELYRSYPKLESDKCRQELIEVFAFYLQAYSNTELFYQGERIDPSGCIKNKESFPLSTVFLNDQKFEVHLDIVEWNDASERVLYLCDLQGLPLEKTNPNIHAPGFSFAGYLKSDYISKLNQEGLLDISALDDTLSNMKEEAQKKLKEYFQKRAQENAKGIVEEWKADKIYPYKGQPENQIEEAERQVFDIVALNVKDYLPAFADSDKTSKAFQFRMLKQAIEKNPDELQLILGEVLDLPPNKQTELAKILKRTSLSAIINVSKTIADRLDFIDGLETILFVSDHKKVLKERSQLHRILADNTWVFGEEFNLTVDDRGLTEVLKKHAKLQKLDILINDPVKRLDGSTGIIDLMMSRMVPKNHENEREHLIVELKSPTVKIGSKEITQIKAYAYAIEEDERFRSLNTRWTFVVVSNDYDKFTEKEIKQANLSEGILHHSETSTIWVKTWSQIIGECKHRMRFLKKGLEYSIDQGTSLNYLKETYAKYLEGVVEEEKGLFVE